MSLSFPPAGPSRCVAITAGSLRSHAERKCDPRIAADGFTCLRRMAWRMSWARLMITSITDRHLHVVDGDCDTIILARQTGGARLRCSAIPSATGRTRCGRPRSGTGMSFPRAPDMGFVRVP